MDRFLQVVRIGPELFDRMVEIGIRIGFAGEGEMPPFFGDGFESAAHHGFAEDHPVLELDRVDLAAGRPGGAGERPGIFARFRIPAPVRMAFLAEPVESAAHIQFFPAGHIEQGQVDRAAAAVARFLGNIALGEQDGFVQIGIKQ